MSETASIELVAPRRLGPDWPAVRRWKVTGEQEIDGVELVSRRRPEHYVLAHRAITGDRAWQATWFDADGAGGDLRRATLEEAINDQAPAAEYTVTAIHLKSARKANPTMAEPKKAIRMFRRFHTRDYRGEGDLHADFQIPDVVQLLGRGENVDYESDKLNPTDGTDEGWIPYTHEHSAGVHTYRPIGRGAGGENVVTVPAWIRNVKELTWLGRFLGLGYRDESGKLIKVEGTNPLPELYTIPSGKALMVIQGKRRLLMMSWGGKLGVERRGIVH